MQPVTNSEGQKGFYSESTGFIGLDAMQKVTNESGQRGYYHEKAGFVPVPSGESQPDIPVKPVEKGIVEKRIDNVAKIYTPDPNDSPARAAVKNIPGNRELKTLYQVAGFANDVAGKVVGALTPQSVENAVGSFMAESPGIRKDLQRISDFREGLRQSSPEASEHLEGMIDVASFAPVGKGMSVAGGGVKTGMKKGVNAMYPDPTPKAAVGQVLQGKTKDIPKGEKAFAVVDTKGVETYADLLERFNPTIETYAKRVDDALSVDKTVHPLDTLKTVEKTAGGKVIEQNFVEKAITQLQELYAKTDDLVKAGEMDDLLAKAKASGLTKKEVNDIARVYGSEYKAFNPASGDPLTSVNPQMYENVRKGLKEVARRGLDDTAKELDDTLSGLLNTRRLIEKNVESANRLRQKVDERGLGEKLGRLALTAMDLATFGTVKGAVLKMFPRGLGYKTKNYLDLEDSLKRNLKIINDEYKRIDNVPAPKEAGPPEPKAGPFVKASEIDRQIDELKNRPTIPGEEGWVGNVPRPFSEAPLPSGNARVLAELEGSRAANLARIQTELAGMGAADMTPWAQWIGQLATVNPLKWTDADVRKIRQLQQIINSKRLSGMRR